MTELIVHNTHKLNRYSSRLSAAVNNQDGAEMGRIVQDLNIVVETGQKLVERSQLDTRSLNEIKAQWAWSMWHLGQFLEVECPHGGARPSKSTLSRLEIPERLSAQSRKFAALDAEDLRHFIDEADSSKELNFSHLFRLQTESESEPPSDREQVIALLAQMLRLAKKVRSSYAASEKERAACVMFEEALG
jgi:hypothetical protein